MKIKQYLELLRQKLDLDEQLENEGCPLCQITTRTIDMGQSDFFTSLEEQVDAVNLKNDSFRSLTRNTVPVSH